MATASYSYDVRKGEGGPNYSALIPKPIYTVFKQWHPFYFNNN